MAYWGCRRPTTGRHGTLQECERQSTTSSGCASDDGLELYSPGGLCNSMTTDDLRTSQFTRNELLASRLGQCPVGEVPGAGGRHISSNGAARASASFRTRRSLWPANRRSYREVQADAFGRAEFVLYARLTMTVFCAATGCMAHGSLVPLRGQRGYRRRPDPARAFRAERAGPPDGFAGRPRHVVVSRDDPRDLHVRLRVHGLNREGAAVAAGAMTSCGSARRSAPRASSASRPRRLGPGCRKRAS